MLDNFWTDNRENTTPGGLTPLHFARRPSIKCRDENKRQLFVTIEISWGRLCALTGENRVIEPILLGIVVGLVPVTIAGLFVAAWLQYKRGNPSSGLGEK